MYPFLTHPILLRNARNEFAQILQSQEVYFADSLTLFKALIKCKHPSLSINNDNTRFPKANQSSIYEALFNEAFDAHDAVEDVFALRKILFSSRLDLCTETIVNESSLVSIAHAVEDMNSLDHRHNIMQSFDGNLYHPRSNGPLTKNMVEKIAGSGLSYEDLKRTFIKYGKEGIEAILSKPPTCLSANSKAPRVTRTSRILAVIVQ